VFGNSWEYLALVKEQCYLGAWNVPNSFEKRLEEMKQLHEKNLAEGRGEV
jgi:hypothetical protein